MTDKEIVEYIQSIADNDLSQIETFNSDIREQIKSEYIRMIAEREEWLKNRQEE